MSEAAATPNRLSLSERVLDITMASVADARVAWAKVRNEIPDSRHKRGVDEELRLGDKRAIRETATRLYIWLEGYEAAREAA